MRKTVLLCLVLLFGCLALQAQSVSNVRSEFNSEYGYYEIKYDLNGSADKVTFVSLSASLGQFTHENLKTVRGHGVDSRVKPGWQYTLFWHPHMEGLPSGNWRFSVEPSTVGMIGSMLYAYGSTFMMGSDDSGDERPVHEVLLSSFLISKCPVTQKEWQEVMGSNPSHFKGDNLPVEKVSWYDAIDYCNERSIKEGLTPCYSGSGDEITCNWNANGYRLPTEAEWEYAARGGSVSKGYKYAGSNMLSNVAWYDDNSSNRTHPVGEKDFNELRLNDMSGNVYEWCWDWYDSSYYNHSPRIDPRGPTSGDKRVLRGGSWYTFGGSCRVSYRHFSTPDRGSYYTGFRVTRIIER